MASAISASSSKIFSILVIKYSHSEEIRRFSVENCPDPVLLGVKLLTKEAKKTALEAKLLAQRILKNAHDAILLILAAKLLATDGLKKTQLTKKLMLENLKRT